MKKGFITFNDKRPVIEKLNWEQRGRLFTAMLNYSCGVELPEMDDKTEIVFMVMQSAMDECDRKYEATVEKRRSAGQKGGFAKASNAKQNLANASKTKQTLANPSKTYLTDTDTETVTNTDTETETNTDTETETNTEVSKETSVIKAGKPPKHKHGEYQHVLLTDEEMNRLLDEYGEGMTAKYVRFLDEYIEEKGYKSKSHYLAIRRWVTDAVKKEEEKEAKTGNPFLRMLEA